TSLFTHLVSRGNASLHLRGCGPRDRGRYKCHVRTSAGVHEAHVIVRVEGESSCQSNEVKCTTGHVYPAPHVAWATDPPTAQPLRPITRKLADRQGLYAVESRLRRLNSQSELTYICTVISSYGSQTWTASLRERAINGVEGKDLTIPCHAPPYQPKSSVSWSFTNHNEEALILTYDSQSQLSSASAPWEACARLDVLRVPLGDGSLQLVNPVSLEHTGTYTCVYSSPQNTHTEHTGVNISAVTGGDATRRNALGGAALKPFEDLRTHAKSFQSPEG
uniref:Ig-like domain-containing protein n=1 Tax=Oncorhynchus kisutch TaxID=8019 RepID=A0A8C7D332_ONCKI